VSERLIPLGELVTTHGIDGWLKFKPYNPETTFFSTSRQIVLEKDGHTSAHEVEASNPQSRYFLLKLRGIDSIEDALNWVGFTVSVREDDLQPLGPGEYYHFQAVGLEVFDTKGERIGVVTRTWSTPAGELYVVQGPEREHLIPAVKEIVEKIDLAAGKLIIDPPEGLLDL
jgi:16S rRNA processing protein RimM